MFLIKKFYVKEFCIYFVMNENLVGFKLFRLT